MAKVSKSKLKKSTERSSDFTLQDGTVIRAKASITSAIRVDGQYGPDGNPMYMINLTPVISIISVPDKFRKKVQ